MNAYDAVKHQVATSFANMPPSTLQLRGTIARFATSTGKGYTVTRNALNRLTREGACVRKLVAGFYIYTFTRPVAASAFEPVQ